MYAERSARLYTAVCICVCLQPRKDGWDTDERGDYVRIIPWSTSSGRSRACLSSCADGTASGL